MAETTITGLPNAGPLDGTERVPMDQAGATVDATTADIAALADADPAGTAAAAVAAHVAAGDPHPGYLLETDPAVTNARTPTAHAASHATGQADEISPASIGAATTAQGALADSALQPGDPPTAHAASHATGQSDAIAPAAIGAATAAQGALADSAVQPGDLGTAAALNVGTGPSQVVQLDGSSRLPAVDGSQLTNLPPGGATDLDGLTDVTITTPQTDHVLKYDGAGWVNGASPGGGGGTVTSVGLVAPTGFTSTGGPITTSGNITLGFDTGYQGFTTAEASKLAGIAAGAEVNVNADWNAGSGDAQILNKPTLGGAAALNVGTSAGTVAAGDDARFHDSVTLAASLTDVLGLTGQAISGVDAGADRLLFWDDSAGKLTHLTLGTNLAIADTTLNATDTNTTYSAGTGLSLATTTFSIDSTVATLTGTQTLTNKTLGDLKETVHTVTDGASVDLDPADGPIQVWTLGANRTPTATSFAAGQSMYLMIADGTAYSVTWTTIGVVWVGGSAPTLATTGYTIVELWKVSSTVYGARVGDVAS